MGRREKPIEPGQGKAAEFAADLRMLRRRTGNVPYRELASRVPYSASSLSAAASGHRLPAWQVVAAYLEACGVTSTGEWYRRWRQAAGLPPEPEPAVGTPSSGPQARPATGPAFPLTGGAPSTGAPGPAGEPPYAVPGVPRQMTGAEAGARGGAPYGAVLEPSADHGPGADSAQVFGAAGPVPGAAGPVPGAAGAAESVPHAPRGVPDPPSRFVGRDHEVEEVCRLLAEHRLLTLTGVGGVGKTRLAQRAARTAGLLLRDGACWVELAEVTSPDVLPYAVVEGLGLAPVPPHTTPTAHLTDALRGRELLLVLDNCEHLAAACARLAHLLLASTSGVRLLATSRLPLGPAAERLYVVPPLPEDASLALLSDRAALLSDATWSPDDVEHARAVIRRLDGLPLAIEFAARRLRALSPGQLLDRLDERLPLLSKGDPVAPERHRSLRAMLDWSHQLCTPAEQRLWARLSVFVGSVSLDAAHAVWEAAGSGEEGEETGPEELLDAVDGLIDHSLLVTEPGDGAGRRYTMLETVREYGRDLLARGGDLDDARTRHLLWFRDKVCEVYERWAGPGQAARLRELVRELPNLRQALEYGLREEAEPAQALAALDIAHGLVWFWTATGAAEQGVGWLRRALAATAPADPDPAVRAARTRAMWACAFLAVFPADLEAAAGQAVEAAERADADGDRASVGWATTVTALATLTGGGVEESLDAFRVAVAHLRAAGDRYGEQNALSILASALCAAGRLDEAGSCVERAFHLSRAQDEHWHRPYLSWVRAKILVVERRLTGPDGALAHVLGILCPQRDFADPRALALGHDTLAHCAWLLGRHREAARLFGASEARWPVDETRIAAYRVETLDTARCLEELRSALGEDGYRAARAEGAALPAEEAREWAIRFASDAM
jgi:predicted ATPase